MFYHLLLVLINYKSLDIDRLGEFAILPQGKSPPLIPPKGGRRTGGLFFWKQIITNWH